VEILDKGQSGAAFSITRSKFFRLPYPGAPANKDRTKSISTTSVANSAAIYELKAHQRISIRNNLESLVRKAPERTYRSCNVPVCHLFKALKYLGIVYTRQRKKGSFYFPSSLALSFFSFFWRFLARTSAPFGRYTSRNSCKLYDSKPLAWQSGQTERPWAFQAACMGSGSFPTRERLCLIWFTMPPS